jgi:N-acetylglucosamine malate deacetylase 1
MTPYHALATECARLLKEGRALPLGTFDPVPRPPIAPHAPKALFFAPHPDDECIAGALALRLMRQGRMHLANAAVTLGSKKERQAGRLQELRNACHFLGFELLTTAPNGLERISPQTRERDPAHWSACVSVIQGILQTHQPKVVLCPHDRDWSSAHIGTHFLVLDALKRLPPSFECYFVETEFWRAMTDPNLLVEISTEDVGDLMAAASFHLGEVSRNPYHVLLPAWLMDNVRRGAEIVGGQGAAAPDFTFGALYRLRKWSHGHAAKFFDGGRQIPCSMNVRDIFV